MAGVLIAVLLPGDIWQCLETYLVVTTWGGATGVSWVEARDVAKHPKYRTAPHNTQLSSPKCQSPLRIPGQVDAGHQQPQLVRAGTGRA